MRPLRVAHVIHSLGPGGAEHVLVELAGAASSAGLELVVIGLSPPYHEESAPVHARNLRELGVPVVELDLPRWDPRAVPRSIAVVRAHRVQLVHTHLKHADLVGTVAGRRLGLPVLSTLHLIEDAPSRPVDRLKRAAGLAARRRLAARTIALSNAQRAWYRELSGSDDGIVVLPNGVADPPLLSEPDRHQLRADLGVGPDALLVVSASLMRPEKGHDLLLDAVALIPAAPALTVALAGDGPLRAGLEARAAAEPRLRDRVRFLGYRDDVPALLQAADLVLHTSLADALPTILIHALAVGTPAVATAVGGIPDIVADGETGTLVPTDATEIADAVGALAGDWARRARYAVAGRDRFLARFEATGWAGRLRTVYEDVLNGAGVSR